MWGQGEEVRPGNITEAWGELMIFSDGGVPSSIEHGGTSTICI